MSPTEKDDDDDDDAPEEERDEDDEDAEESADRDGDEDEGRSSFLPEPSEADILEGEVVDDTEAVTALPVLRSTKSDSGSLAKSDPLQAYMRDVQRYPLLNREDEHKLAVRYFEK